jgi:hypothetical protein
MDVFGSDRRSDRDDLLASSADRECVCVRMNQFWCGRNPNYRVMTMGMLDCALVAVELDGNYGFGHFDVGPLFPENTKGLSAVVGKLIGTEARHIVFAGGTNGTTEQPHEKIGAWMEEVRVSFHDARVEWPVAPEGFYEAAVLLPREDALLLFTDADMPRIFPGSPYIKDGVQRYEWR